MWPVGVCLKMLGQGCGWMVLGFYDAECLVGCFRIECWWFRAVVAMFPVSCGGCGVGFWVWVLIVNWVGVLCCLWKCVRV